MSVIIIATLFIIVMIVASYVYTGYKRREEYYKSDYSSQTKKNYGEVVIDKGSMGEYDTYRYLDKIEGYKKCLFNTFIPKTNGETTEVDLILLHESGIYVIESKNYSGWIFGDERNNQWTQTLKGSYGTCEKIRFFNPIKQNESHIKWISKYLKIDESELKSIIVFSNRCEFKDITITSDTVMVVKRKDVPYAISSCARSCNNKLSQTEIDRIYDILYPLTQISEEEKREHRAKVMRTKELSQKYADKRCPICGRKLVLRTASKGQYKGRNFLGCSGYPDCRYIENIEGEINIDKVNDRTF